jgi:type IV secretion system protein VirD4
MSVTVLAVKPPAPSPSTCDGGLLECPPSLNPLKWQHDIFPVLPGGWLTVLAVLALLIVVAGWRYRPAPKGMAGSFELWRRASLTSVRWSSRQTRQSLGWARWWAPPADVGIYLGRSRHPRRRLLSSFEDSILVVGLAGQGKDTWAGNAIIDAPGAVLATTTKAEDLAPWIRLRARKGPVIVFNPDGLGGLPSSLRFSPVSGCRDPEMAIQTAGYLLMGSSKLKGMAHEEFFTAAAAKVLRCLLIAAACSGRTLTHVYAWTCDETNTEPLELLERANAETPGRPYNGFLGDLRSVFTSRAGATSGSTYQTLSSLLQFMASPAVASTVDVSPDDGGLDVALFLRAHTTLCLLGADKDTGTTAPLLTCLVGRIVEEAQIIASHQPGGRLDPPLTLFLNEASKIVPLPVDRYFADHRGKNIPTIVMVQSRAHLVSRWGKERGAAIWDTATVKLLYGGSMDEDYLSAVQLAGGHYTHREPMADNQQQGLAGRMLGPQHREKRFVIDAADLRMVTKFRYYVIRANMRPTKAKTRKVWTRWDVKRAFKASPEWPTLHATVTPQIAVAVEEAEQARRDVAVPRRIWVGVRTFGRGSAAPMLWEDPR